MLNTVALKLIFCRENWKIETFHLPTGPHLLCNTPPSLILLTHTETDKTLHKFISLLCSKMLALQFRKDMAVRQLKRHRHCKPYVVELCLPDNSCNYVRAQKKYLWECTLCPQAATNASGLNAGCLQILESNLILEFWNPGKGYAPAMNFISCSRLCVQGENVIVQSESVTILFGGFVEFPSLLDCKL